MRPAFPSIDHVSKARSDDLEKARQRLNVLNIRLPEPRESAVFHSTGRLNAGCGDGADRAVERSLDLVFAALADPTRRAMLAALRGGDAAVGDLAAPHAMSFAGAAKHVAVLERAGLVVRCRAGRRIMCRLQPDRLAAVDAWLRRYDRYRAPPGDPRAAVPSAGQAA